MIRSWRVVFFPAARRNDYRTAITLPQQASSWNSMVDFIPKSKRFRFNHGSTIRPPPPSCHNSSAIASLPAMSSILPANTLCDAAGKGWGWGDHMVGVTPSAIPAESTTRFLSRPLPLPSTIVTAIVNTVTDTYLAPTGAVEGLVPSRSRTRSWCLFLLTTYRTTTPHPLVSRPKRIFYFHYSQPFALIFINVKYQCKIDLIPLM